MAAVGRTDRRPAVVVALLLLGVACGDDDRPAGAPAAVPTASRAAADPAIGATTELDGVAPAFGEGVLAELTGDEPAARAAYERVLAAPDVPSTVAARAALYLAAMESRTGRIRHALDLTARATALAPNDAVVSEGAAALRADVVAAAGAGDIRGPRLGTPLTGAPPDVADAFAAAERALAQWHKARLRIVLEALTRSITNRINRTASVVARYRAIAERGGIARVAATYRGGSLYHDLALELAFADLPPELEKGKASLRETLNNLAIVYLKKAVAEYRAALAARVEPSAGGDPAAAELWRLAAETNMRRALDVLRAAGIRIPAP